jgi:hypothetical protein
MKADAQALNDDDAVSTWTDSSGNGNDATQGTGSAKPTFKTNILNGEPVIRFDGGDRLAFATEYIFDVANPTIFVVANLTSGSSG